MCEKSVGAVKSLIEKETQYTRDESIWPFVILGKTRACNCVCSAMLAVLLMESMRIWPGVNVAVYRRPGHQWVDTYPPDNKETKQKNLFVARTRKDVLYLWLLDVARAWNLPLETRRRVVLEVVNKAWGAYGNRNPDDWRAGHVSAELLFDDGEARWSRRTIQRWRASLNRALSGAHLVASSASQLHRDALIRWQMMAV